MCGAALKDRCSIGAVEVKKEIPDTTVICQGAESTGSLHSVTKRPMELVYNDFRFFLPRKNLNQLSSLEDSPCNARKR
jgi:hypothetical protein